MHPFPQTDARSVQSDDDHHFFHTNVFLRHASSASGEADEHIDRILAQAAVAKRRVWVSSLLFAELKPSVFVPGRFGTVQELARYIRSLATLVTPDPNTMLRVARLRDAKWQRAAGVRGEDEKPRMMSFSDAVQIASALWVNEAGGVGYLKFLMFDDWSPNEGRRGAPLSLLRLQDYSDDARANSEVMAAARLTRVQPHRQALSISQTAPAGQERSSVSREIADGRKSDRSSVAPASSPAREDVFALTIPVNSRTPVQRSYPPASGDTRDRTAPRAPVRSRPSRRPCQPGAA